MTTLQLHALSYHHDSAQLFAGIKDKHWPIFLDSGQAINAETQRPGSQFGRYDILVADPVMTFVTQGAATSIMEQGNTTVSTEDPFTLIKRALLKTPTARSHLPFTGGALGYFGYDAARSIEQLPNTAVDDMHMPEIMVGIYNWAVIVDHQHQQTVLVSHQHTISSAQWQALCALFTQLTQVQSEPAQPAYFSVDTAVRSNMDANEYATAFNQVKQYIHDGDCYQVNLAQRFSASVEGDAWHCYEKLRALSPAPFMAFMDLQINPQRTLQVLSVSPERFLQLVDCEVETRPIKGTRPRYADPQQDLESAIALLTSQKDRAENVMIVDLLRNDIGKVCEVGSVKAEKLFNLQSFANVHHLVSYVTGKLCAGNTALDLLRSCFPGGSITGAPKLRAMQIIEELEPNRRGVYCGAIGYIGFDGDMDTNIAIRTAVIIDDYIYFYAGGGVVADSTLDKEYRETWDKASNFLATMQHFLRQ